MWPKTPAENLKGQSKVKGKKKKKKKKKKGNE